MPSSHPTKFFRFPTKRPWLFLLAFGLWLVPFHGFILGKLAITADAISYYEHIKFFVDNMLHGVFPLWDPTWNCGIPNEFFLRRINPYNPFFLVIFFLRLLGAKQIVAYLIFLALYFFLGLLGYYRFSRLLFRDHRTAFVSFLLLLFSALGTRMFDAYILLLFTPITWFFYFLLAFGRKPKPIYFLGLTLSLMFLFTTYIPFYFLMIFFFFMVAGLLTFPGMVKTFLQNFWVFVKRHPLLVLVCLAVFMLAVIPGIKFFAVANDQEIVFPARHNLSTEKNVLAVDQKWITGWGTIEEFLFASYFPRFSQLRFALLYVPVFFYILLALGLLTRSNRRMVFLFLWALGLFLLTVPHAVPLYTLMYKHVFFFKYFKNLQFFLWLGILPVVCLLLAEQWQQLCAFRPEKPWQKIISYFLLTAVHAGIFFIYIQWGHRNLSTYVSIALSLVFFLLVWERIIRPGGKFFYALLFLVITLQPLEAFTWLKTSALPNNVPTAYDQPYDLTTLARGKHHLFAPLSLMVQTEKGIKPAALYLTTARFNKLYETVPLTDIDSLIRNKFILYDTVAPLPPDEPGLLAMAKNFTAQQNLAYVTAPDISPRDNPAGPWPARPYLAEQNNNSFALIANDVNTVRIRTNFPMKKFLVYTDNFHSGWQAWVNGQKAKIIPANVAFKGLWLEPGANEIVFHFGSRQDYLFNYLLLGLFYAVFGAILWLSFARPAQEHKAGPA